MANETLKQLNIDVNSNVDTNDRLKTNLKEFLDTTTVEAETKTALEPLVTEVKNDAKFDERLESAVNKQHVTKLLEAMKAKLDSDWYAAVYANYRTTITFAIQSALRIMWFPLPKENIDGKYGTETGDAVEAFQKRQWLTPDRLAWKDTISKMLAVTLDAKYDGTVAPTIAWAEESKDWYTTHTEFTEKEFGWVKNKVYKVEKFEDIPAVIAKDTVIDFGPYYIFSNSAVYEYSADRKTIVRRGIRDELDANGKWKTAIDAVTDKVQHPVDKPLDVITADDMTFDQLQVNLDAIWKKYFDFTLPWQKDFITKYHLENWISVEWTAKWLLIRSKGSSYYLFSLPKEQYETADNIIDTKKIISLVKNDIVDKMERTHYEYMLKEKIDTRYAAWDKIFTKEELSDTTSPQGKKIHDFLSCFDKWATVDVVKKWANYMMNRENGKLYFNFTFDINKNASWNTNESVVDIKSVTDDKWEFVQSKWNEQVRNYIINSKLKHQYFSKYDTKNI